MSTLNLNTKTALQSQPTKNTGEELRAHKYNINSTTEILSLKISISALIFPL